MNPGESRAFFTDRGQWSPMRLLVTAWGQFPSIQPRPTVGEPLREDQVASQVCCPDCQASMKFATLRDLACPNCGPRETSSPRKASAWQASRKQSAAVALVTLVSGFGVMLLALLAWGSRSKLDAALIPVSAPEAWVDAWTSFHDEPYETWHTLAIYVQQAETAFAPLPISWEREGRNGELVWMYQNNASEGCLARLLSDDAQRLKNLLADRGAAKLTIKAKRRDYQGSGLIEIGAVERLGWGKGHREFEAPHRSLTPMESLSAKAWVGNGDSSALLGAAQLEE